MSSQLAQLISLRRTGKNDPECARSGTAWPLLAAKLNAGREARPRSNRRYRLVDLVENRREQTLQSRPWLIREA
jgi:hypothetical protein